MTTTLRSTRPAMAVLAAMAVSIGALESIPFPALPLIQRELGLDPAQAGLLSTTLIITSAVTMPVVAKIADDRGGRRTLLVLTWCIVVGAVLSAFATAFPVMLLGQFLQGLGGGILPVAFVVVRELLQDSTSVAVGVITGLFTVGTGVGVLVSGPLADALSRQWMFLVPALIVAAIALVAPLALPGRVRKPVRTSALLVGMVRILRNRGVRTASLVSGALGASYSATYFLVPQLLSVPPSTGFGFGATPSDISLYLFPTVIVAIVVGPLSGFLVRHAGARTVVAGSLVLTAAGTAFVAVWHQVTWQIVVGLLVTLGIGVGAASTAIYTSAIESADPQHTGVAAATCGIARAIGAVLGVQIAAALLTGAIPPGTQVPAESGFQLGFVVAAGVVLVPLALLRGMRGRTPIASDHATARA